MPTSNRDNQTSERTHDQNNSPEKQPSGSGPGYGTVTGGADVTGGKGTPRSGDVDIDDSDLEAPLDERGAGGGPGVVQSHGTIRGESIEGEQ